jgi:hypothetical protein
VAVAQENFRCAMHDVSCAMEKKLITAFRPPQMFRFRG